MYLTIIRSGDYFAKWCLPLRYIRAQKRLSEFCYNVMHIFTRTMIICEIFHVSIESESLQPSFFHILKEEGI